MIQQCKVISVNNRQCNKAQNTLKYLRPVDNRNVRIINAGNGDGRTGTATLAGQKISQLIFSHLNTIIKYSGGLYIVLNPFQKAVRTTNRLSPLEI